MGCIPHDLLELNYFKSFPLLLTLNTLLGNRAETVNASEGFAAADLELPSSLKSRPPPPLPLPPPPISSYFAVTLEESWLLVESSSWWRLVFMMEKTVPSRLLGLSLESSLGLFA